MTLNMYEMVQPEQSPELYRVVDQLLKTVSYDPDNKTVSLQPKTGNWSVNFIRHKKREAYVVDDKLLLTITAIREYKDPPSKISLSPDHKTDPHIEVNWLMHL